MSPITNTIDFNGQEYRLEFYPDTDFEKLELEKIGQSYGFSFMEGSGEMVIVRNVYKNTWSPTGGTVEIEKGEHFEDTLKREVEEESNMEVLKYKRIGYQKAINVSTGNFGYQLRFACIVKKIGDFIEDGDPNLNIVEVKTIDPKYVKNYFNWGEIGDYIMEESLKWVSENK